MYRSDYDTALARRIATCMSSRELLFLGLLIFVENQRTLVFSELIFMVLKFHDSKPVHGHVQWCMNDDAL